MWGHVFLNQLVLENCGGRGGGGIWRGFIWSKDTATPPSVYPCGAKLIMYNVEDWGRIGGVYEPILVKGKWQSVHMLTN
jgi:hypothetical protein